MTIDQILTEKGLDTHQREAVYSDSNTVVSAGAGSGKTTVLSYRFLRLVMEGKATVDSILTLTFTKKAAAEMHERIHEMLLAHKDDPQVARNLDRLERSQISTLDSFCSQIVRSDCRRFGYAASFTQDEEAIRQISSSTALSFIHERLNDPAMQHLLALHSFEGVCDKLLIPLAAYHMCPSRIVDYREVFEEQLKISSKSFKEFESSLVIQGALILDLDGSKKSLTDAQIFITNLLDAIDSIDDLSELLSSLSVMKFPRMPAKNATDEQLIILRDALTQIKEIWHSYLILLNFIAHEKQIVPCYLLIEEFQKQFLRKKRAAGLLSFSDIAQMAIDILIGNEPLRDYYKKRFSHIMIDEFQDNNDQQRQLLYLLSERDDEHAAGIPTSDQLKEGKLFFVGDEKQSIYQFRGADVSVFKALSQEITQIGGIALTLATNYRSEPGLIETFNDIFPKIMKEPDEAYEAEFQPLGSRSPREGLAPRLHVLIKEKESTESQENDSEDTMGDESFLDPDEHIHDTDAEAWYIAQMISRIVREKGTMIYDAEKGIHRAAGFDDMAILMQSLSNQMKYERALRGLGIPFNAQSIRALFLEAPLNDIYQLLQLIVYPEDRHAFAALLRSPFVNLDDDILFTLMHGQPELRAFDPACDDCISEDAPAYERYMSIKRLYEELVTIAGSRTKAELIEFLWYEGGYRYFIMRRPQNHRYLEYVDYAKELAMVSDAKGESLAEFLDGIRVRLGTHEKIQDVELLKTDSSGVKLMTIHKSKGLEFPIVFVTNMGSKGRGDTEPIYSYSVGIPGPVITCTDKVLFNKANSANYFYFRDKELRKNTHIAEMKRLLYVSATRAEAHLFLSGCYNAPGKNADPAGVRNLLDLVLTGFSLDPYDPLSGEDTVRLPQSSARIEVELHKIGNFTEGDITRMREYTTSSYHPEITLGEYEKASIIEYEERAKSIGVTERAHEKAPVCKDGIRLPSLEVDKILSKTQIPEFGTFCHHMIETTISGVPLEAGLPSEFSDLTEDEKQILISDATDLHDRFIASDLYSRYSKDPLVKLESEVPFMMRDDGILLKGVIDLLIETTEEVYVIDFKTDSVKYADNHQYQLQSYIKAMGLYTGKPVHGKIWYLREGENLAWDQ